MDDKLWGRRVFHLPNHTLLASGYNILTMDDDIFFGWKSVRSLTVNFLILDEQLVMFVTMKLGGALKLIQRSCHRSWAYKCSGKTCNRAFN